MQSCSLQPYKPDKTDLLIQVWLSFKSVIVTWAGQGRGKGSCASSQVKWQHKRINKRELNAWCPTQKHHGTMRVFKNEAATCGWTYRDMTASGNFPLWLMKLKNYNSYFIKSSKIWRNASLSRNHNLKQNRSHKCFMSSHRAVRYFNETWCETLDMNGMTLHLQRRSIKLITFLKINFITNSKGSTTINLLGNLSHLLYLWG